MKLVDWSMEGVEFANCNCAVGCPCQFNALPTHGHCRAFTFVQIDQGHFGGVSLDGLRWGIMGQWPGPIHLGEGTFLSIIDERADPTQRQALESISQGKETEPGKLIWQVFSAMVTKTLPTQYRAIELTIDVEKGEAKVNVPGLLEGSGAPIRNPVTGKPHRARLTLPTGFEFNEGEFISGNARGQSGEIDLKFEGTHAHLARIHWSTAGVVR